MNTISTVGNFIYSLKSNDKKIEVSVIRPGECKHLFYIQYIVETHQIFCSTPDILIVHRLACAKEGEKGPV